MKKLIAILVAGLAFTASLFADVPEFTDETAYVVDTSVLPGNMKDNVVVTNVSSLAANFDITIFVYDEESKGWMIFGKGHIKDLGDVSTIKSINKKMMKLANYKYFAIKPSADNPFTYSVAKGNNDLNVWIYDDREIDESHFKVFDLSMLPTFTDNLRVVAGENLRSAASFRILVYNDEADEEKSGTIAILTKPKDTKVFKTTAKGQKYNLFKYVKIISREEKDYKYTVNVAKNDLVITVNNQ
ncbi:MAG: hypothetical protein SPL22_13080 [Treponema sp.]|jgi:hypothetical protein|uniref:hypothetical protein n=1 Tax=Treponema sp. TaxID=166 RepID=UPI002A916534|nr:hypothetical protein [Treponema sp.]MDY6398646.1 hypothetical protein [Treponema sp.]